MFPRHHYRNNSTSIILYLIIIGTKNRMKFQEKHSITFIYLFFSGILSNDVVVILNDESESAKYIAQLLFSFISFSKCSITKLTAQ